MRAIIMAGGRGERLKPYTTIIPKPLMPIGDVSILEVVIRRLKQAGITNITIAVGYLGNLIEAYVGDGSKFGVEVHYVYEEKPLSTIGPLAFIDGLNDTFLVMNGDILSDIDFLDMLNFHKSKNAVATIATYRRLQKIDFGVLEYDEKCRISNFIEKPEYDYKVSMGIYFFEPEILKYIPRGEAYGVDRLVMDMLQKNDRLFSYNFSGYWLDIGRPDDYEVAIEKFRYSATDFFGDDNG